MLQDNIKLTGEQEAQGVSSDRNVVSTTKDFDKNNMPLEGFNLDDVIQDAPIEFLCNLYDLFDVAVSDTMSFTSVQLDPWLSIWNNISSLLSTRWRYFKCDMKIIITVDSGPFDYGSFLIGWYPEQLTPSFDRVNADPWLFDLSTGGTHELVIPYSNVTKCYDVRRGQEQIGYWNCVPKLYMTSLNVGTMAKAFSTNVHFKGQFTNMKVWGVTHLANDITLEDDFGIVSQMDGTVHSNPLVNVAKTATALGGVLAAATTTVGAINGGLSKYKEFHKVASEAWGIISSYYDNDCGVFTGTTLEPTDGIDKKEIDAGSNQLQNQPTFFGGMTDVGFKPMENLSVTMKRVIPYGLAEREMFHNVRSLSQIPCLIRCGRFRKNDVIYEGVSPFPSAIRDDGGSANDYSLIRRVDYLSQFSQLFRFWRGSIKYTLTLHTNAMITGRFMIQVMNNGTEDIPGGLLNPSIGPFVFKKQLEVTGFYKFDFVVPFVFMYDWAPVAASGLATPQLPINPSYFTVTCLSITSGLDGSANDPEITYNLFRSGGDDIQYRNFAGLRRLGGAFLEEEEVVSQMKVRSFGDSKYENICRGSPNLFMLRPVDEDALTIETLLHRWSLRDNDRGGNLIDPISPYDQANMYTAANLKTHANLFDYLFNMFRYVRGNVQYRIPVPEAYTGQFFQVSMYPPANVVSTTPVGPISDTSRGAALALPSLNPVLDFEVPIEGIADWFITFPSLFTASQQPPRIFGHYDEVEVSIAFMFVRAGRAFQVAYLNPPLVSWDSIMNSLK